MTFTPEQRAALDLLESSLVTRDVALSEISRYVDYPKETQAILEHALIWYKRFKIAEATDFDEIDRLQRIERDRIIAERSHAVRENIILSNMTSMFSKLVKAYPTKNVTFGVVGRFIEITVEESLGDDIVIMYDKQTFDFLTCFPGYDGSENFEVVDGSTPFREHSEGFNQLLNYIGDVK